MKEFKTDNRETELSKAVKEFLNSGDLFLEVKKEDANKVQNYLRVQHGFKNACFRSLPHRPGTSWVFLGRDDFYELVSGISCNTKAGRR